MPRIKSKPKVSNSFIDKHGELHIVTQHGEVIFKNEIIEEILLFNYFKFQGKTYKLFKDEHSEERERLMQQFYS